MYHTSIINKIYKRKHLLIKVARFYCSLRFSSRRWGLLSAVPSTAPVPVKVTVPLLAALLPLRQATVRSLVEKVGFGNFWSIRCVKAVVAHVRGFV